MSNNGNTTPNHPSGGLARIRLPRRASAVMLATLGAMLVAAGLLLGLPDTPLNLYDVSFSLLWGRELLAGTLPNVQVFGASTPTRRRSSPGLWRRRSMAMRSPRCG
jgi:hypothetical protein